MTTCAPQLSAEQMQDLIEATIRARRQINAADLQVAVHLGLGQLRRHLRILALDGRIHRVRPMGGGAPLGGIWAAGPDPADLDGEEAIAEPIHLYTKTWLAPKVRFSPLEMCLFGRAHTGEVWI